MAKSLVEIFLTAPIVGIYTYVLISVVMDVLNMWQTDGPRKSSRRQSGCTGTGHHSARSRKRRDGQQRVYTRSSRRADI